ncbi:HNH/ENDO VII family nuclease, partial [Bartonella sp. AA97HXZ]|uniref:HNH/ENDO VII family nuclease n=1 Tax=Bartonella sp. AA97HXZ TaxID=1460972 RepID=UPI0035D116CE
IDTVTQIVAHAGLGCLKGAVASGACTAGAVGGAVGEATAMLQFQLWVQGIVKEEMGDLNGRTPTAEEEARINAKIDAQFADFRDHTIDVARAAGGVAAALAGGNVDAGADAAGNAAANNYLSSAQIAQMNKELKECPDLLCEAEVSAKWSAISTGQGISFGAGIVAGVPAEVYGTVDGFLQIISSPTVGDLIQIAKNSKEILKALKDFFTSGKVLATLGHAFAQPYVDRINKMEEEYERAGAGGSFNAGLEFGKLLTEVATLFLGGAGTAKGAIKLGEKTVIKFNAMKDFAQFASKKNLAELAAQGDPDKFAARKELTKLAAKEKKLWLKKKPTKFTDSKFGQTYTVYRRDDLFDPNKRVKWTEKGETVWGTNIDRMKARRAPIGYDGKSVELHHLNQTPDGPLAEMSHEFHKKYTSVIHANPKTHQSLIDRKKFEKQREEYWYKLGNGYGEQENSSLGGIINMKWGIIGLNFDRWGQKHRQ